MTALGYFLLTPYVPPLTHYLLTIFAMFLFIYIAYKIPSKNQKTKGKKTGKTKLFWIAGLGSTIIFFLLFWAGPNLINFPIFIMLLGIALVFGMLRLLNRFDWEDLKSAPSQLAIVAGALSFLIFLAFLHELNGMRGMSLVGLTSIIGLLLLRQKLKNSRSTLKA